MVNGKSKGIKSTKTRQQLSTRGPPVHNVHNARHPRNRAHTPAPPAEHVPGHVADQAPAVSAERARDRPSAASDSNAVFELFWLLVITLAPPMTADDFPLIPFLFATALAVNGLRRRSLSPSGAAAAFLTGISMLSLPLRTPGIALIIFYLLGSRATRVGTKAKAALEDGHDSAGGGYRNAVQVFSNSASALIATLLWGALFHPTFPEGRAVAQAVGAPRKQYHPARWCPLDARVASGWSRSLLFVVLGHFACCLGDTLASELGILARGRPRLITTLRPVPPGTNGALSLVGTGASLAGGAIMGLSMWATLVLENGACRAAAFRLLPDLLLWGVLGGGLGSLLDSVLGATLQRTQYSKDKRILTDASDPRKAAEAGVQVVSGINVLTNNQVNLIASTLTALALGYLA